MNTHIHLITGPIDHKIHKIIITCVSLSIGISFTTEKNIGSCKYNTYVKSEM
jgi:hypothetical protein